MMNSCYCFPLVSSLTYMSMYRKVLLTKGLRFMMEVFHLFPLLDNVVAEAKACALRMEAISASQFILEQLLAHIVPVDEDDKCGREDVEIEPKEETNFPSLEPELDSIPPVTDEMREMDKQTRLQVLLKLLQLACVMVRVKTQKLPH